MTIQNHGGKRDGAGRKRLPQSEKHITISAALAPDLVEKLDAKAKAEGKSRSRLLADIIKAALV